MKYKVSGGRLSVNMLVLLYFLCNGFSMVCLAQQPTATISKLTGKAIVNGQLKGQGTALNAGDVLETQAGTTVVLTLSEGSTLEIGENTKIDLAELSQTADGARVSRIKMAWGEVEGVLSAGHQKNGSAFDIETPTTVAGVKFSNPHVKVTCDRATGETKVLAFTVPVVVRNIRTGATQTVPVGSTATITTSGIQITSGLGTPGAAPAGSEKTSPKVTAIMVADVNGTVQRLSKEDVRDNVRVLSALWKPALPKTLLNQGDQIQTGLNSSMRLQLSDGTAVMLAGDTLLVVEELRSARGDAPQTIQLKLETGKITTQQTTRILGQTNQIIRTENGSVKTTLGEVEVSKTGVPGLLSVRSAPDAPEGAPKTENRDQTEITLIRGTAVIEASGQGRIITKSFVLAKTCIAQDGVKFTLEKAKSPVSIVKLEDGDGFRLSANEDFYGLFGTEGEANIIDVATQNSTSGIDIEGINVVEHGQNGRSVLALNPLLSVGVKSSDIIVRLQCDKNVSKGLSEFTVRNFGDATTLESDLGMGSTNPPAPSKQEPAGAPTATPTVPPLTPTATPVPGVTGPTPTPVSGPTPTPTPTPTPGPGLLPPIPGPVTDVLNPVPFIDSLTLISAISGGCGGTQDRIALRFHYKDQTADVFGGQLIRTQSVPPGGGPYHVTVDDPPRLTRDTVVYNYPAGESGFVNQWFCIDFLTHTDVDLTIQLRDKAGNTSASLSMNVLKP